MNNTAASDRAGWQTAHTVANFFIHVCDLCVYSRISAIVHLKRRWNGLMPGSDLTIFLSFTIVRPRCSLSKAVDARVTQVHCRLEVLWTLLRRWDDKLLACTHGYHARDSNDEKRCLYTEKFIKIFLMIIYQSKPRRSYRTNIKNELRHIAFKRPVQK